MIQEVWKKGKKNDKNILYGQQLRGPRLVSTLQSMETHRLLELWANVPWIKTTDSNLKLAHLKLIKIRMFLIVISQRLKSKKPVVQPCYRKTSKKSNQNCNKFAAQRISCVCSRNLCHCSRCYNWKIINHCYRRKVNTLVSAWTGHVKFCIALKILVEK